MHWIREAFRRSFDYSGRSRRMEYWSYALFAFVLMNIFGYIETKLGWRGPDAAGGRDGSLLGSIMLVTLAVPGLAVAVRRLHDSGRAGWWLALPAAPILFWIVALIGGFNSPALFTPVLVAILVAPLLIVAFMCLPGTRGPNRFGSDPKAEDLADIFA